MLFISAMILHGKLIAQHKDLSDYITYIFINVDDDRSKKDKYLMCTRFPNWESDSIKIGDIGYVYYEERRAGIDEWFDGSTFIKYRYDMIQFIKFIPEPKESDKEIFLI